MSRRKQPKNREKTMPKNKFPPDPEKTNTSRAAWAGAALRHFRCITGADHEDALGDLLCDLMHWSDRNNYDFDLALSRAHGHYEAETSAPPVYRSLQSATEGR
jgi:hypothetical protein